MGCEAVRQARQGEEEGDAGRHTDAPARVGDLGDKGVVEGWENGVRVRSRGWEGPRNG